MGCGNRQPQAVTQIHYSGGGAASTYSVPPFFVNDDGGTEYVEAKIGFFRCKKTVLIPVEFVSADGGRRSIVPR